MLARPLFIKAKMVDYKKERYPDYSANISKFYDPMERIYLKHLQRIIQSIDFQNLSEKEQQKVKDRIKKLYYGD